ncbi:MAG: hypothetical protein IJD79_07610 [Clostridia bacterium]|nr:hypothetical protein [Clostridia bacterium]
MKKILICAIATVLVFSLASCIPINKKLNIIGDIEDITAIDVYYIDITDEKIVSDTLDEYESVYSVPAGDISDFAKEMETIVYKKYYCIIPIDYIRVFAPGYIVCIEFSDGEHEIFSQKGTLTHNGYYPEEYSGPLSWEEEIESLIK